MFHVTHVSQGKRRANHVSSANLHIHWTRRDHLHIRMRYTWVQVSWNSPEQSYGILGQLERVKMMDSRNQTWVSLCHRNCKVQTYFAGGQKDEPIMFHLQTPFGLLTMVQSDVRCANTGGAYYAFRINSF